MLLVEKLEAFFFCAVKFNTESSAKVEGTGNNERKGKISDKEYGHYRENISEKLYENINNEESVYERGVSEKYSV